MTVIPEPGTRRERGSPARPLLEREEELAVLSALIEAAPSGDGRLVVIVGPAGIGALSAPAVKFGATPR